MNLKEIKQTNAQIHHLLDESRINEAFSAIDSLIQEAGIWEVREQTEQLRISYRFMLQYLGKGIEDPKRKEVYNDIVNKLYTIADSLTLSLLTTESTDIIAARRRDLKDMTLNEIVERQRAELNKLGLLNSVPDEQLDYNAIATVIKQNEIHETAIFNKVWSSFPLTANESDILKTLINDGNYPEHAKCLIISALFLGLMCYYDENKLQLLMDAYCTAKSAKVQLRALISVLLTEKEYSSRFIKSSTLLSHAKAMTGEEHFKDDLATVLFQLARSRNTENINRKVKEELMPDIMKLNPNMIKIKDDITDYASLEANPEWQEMLENSGIARKMEELNELQLEGSDVFISTFSQLKTFPFFQTLSNWFLPFHDQSSAIYNTFVGDDAPFLMIVSKAPFLCNSDRYSFSLSLKSMPASQRRLMLDQMKAHIEQVDEIEKERIPDFKFNREQEANMYIQDLYRFFKLFSRRREYIAAFDSDMDFTQIPCLGVHVKSSPATAIIAEFYLKNNFFNDAIKYYQYQLDNAQEINPLIYQKMGYCYQSLGKTEDAITNYKRYELADDGNLWTLRNLASCYRENKQFNEAMAYYKKIEAKKPDNVANIINMGHCLLEKGNIKEAMKTYFKADLMDDTNHRARRPVAWCSFLMGNDERSLDYYNRIIDEDTPTAQDYLNRGHVLLATRDIPEALKSYRQAMELMDQEKKTDGSMSGSEMLRKSILNDIDVLKNRGIATDDLPLLIDAITQN